MNTIKALAAALLLAMPWATALAQSPVSTVPSAATTANASASVTLTNTFQQVFAQNSARRGCAIQNTSTSVMYVYFGAIAGATIPKAFPLAPASAAAYPGGSISCLVGGIVLTDQVSVTGTAAATFVATSQ